MIDSSNPTRKKIKCKLSIKWVQSEDFCATDLLSDNENCTITFRLVFSFRSECNHSLASLNKGGFVFLRLCAFSNMRKTVEVARTHQLRFCKVMKIERLHGRYECSLIMKMTGVSANRSPEQCEDWGTDCWAATGSCSQHQASSFSASHGPLPVDASAVWGHFAKSEWLIARGMLNNYGAVWSSVSEKLVLSWHEATPGRVMCQLFSKRDR